MFLHTHCHSCIINLGQDALTNFYLDKLISLLLQIEQNGAKKSTQSTSFMNSNLKDYKIFWALLNSSPLCLATSLQESVVKQLYLTR